VLNASDENFPLLSEILPPTVELKTYAVPSRGEVHGTPDLVATDVTVDWSGTRIACASSDPTLPKEVRVRAIGSVYAENALAALLGAVAAGAPPQKAADAIAAAAPPPGRFEVIHQKPWVVVDYAHSPDALARTVQIAKGLTKGARLFVVFGAGGRRDKDKRKPMGEAARPADVVLLTTDNPREEDPAAIARSIAEGLVGHPGRRTILDRDQAIATAIKEANADDVILIAGKGHETDMIVGDEVRHFSDVEVAKKHLASR
jgi:UDP-N-acetylmuramoyl-L-alanyl-D-glutamate--2,6-diaminopimelate ligase